MIISALLSLVTATVVTVKVNVVVGIIAYFIVNIMGTALIVTGALRAMERERLEIEADHERN